MLTSRIRGLHGIEPVDGLNRFFYPEHVELLRNGNHYSVGASNLVTGDIITSAS
jgi:hypothetical protein